MRIVVWGGPFHDTVLDLPEVLGVVRLVVPDDGTAHVRQRETIVTYRAIRLATAPGSPLARDRREPPWWFVYVPDDDPVDGQRHLAAAQTPLVDGPVKPHPILVARGKRLADPEHDVVPAR